MSISHNAQYATEKSLFEILTIPPHKPDLSRILDTMIIPTVIDYSFMETPHGLSYEGQYLSGMMLIVNLKLTEKLTYMSHTSEETVHSIHYTSIRSVYIALPQEIHSQDTVSRIKSGTFVIHPSIESVHPKLFDTRTIHQTTLLLVNVSLH